MALPRASVGRARVVALAALLGLAGCAQQEFPPGGPEDRRPPIVVQTTPEPLGTLTDLDGPVVFRFDERISERVSGGALETAFTVSPRSGALRVDKGGRSLEVRPEGGFRAGQVYRVTLQAVVSDLFGNRMADPFELVFTTGDAQAVPTTLAGEVWDRISGRAVSEAVVLAESDDDVVYQAMSGSDGIYALRYVSGGELRVTAFEDQNRNGEVDSTEVQGATTVEIAPGDTLLADLAILQPDTAAAVVTAAEALDSVTVVVTFDDYLDPTVDPGTYEVALTAGQGTAPAVERVFHEAGYARHVEMVADSFARLDSIDAAEAEAARTRAADTAASPDTAVSRDTALRPDTSAPPDTAVPPDSAVPPDTIAPPDTALAPDTAAPAPPDTVRVRPLRPRAGAPRQARPGRTPPTALQPLQGSRPGLSADGRRELPARRIVLLLSGPLELDVEYEVRVSDVRNIAGLPGGGGTAELVREPPPPDSVGVADSTAVPDTGGSAAGPPPPGRIPRP